MTSKRDRIRAVREKNRQEARLLRMAGIVVACIIVIGMIYTYWPKPAETPETSRTGASDTQWSSPPEFTINPSVQYVATIQLEKGGNIVIQLFADKAPVTVNNFVFLARQGFYNGTTFHRVIEGFMAQGGDPTGTGAGGPGYQFQDEFSDLAFDRPGLLAMANAGPNTNGSQFFITFAPTEWLTGMHTIFGEVIEGMDVVYGITLRDPATATSPGDVIETITISER